MFLFVDFVLIINVLSYQHLIKNSGTLNIEMQASNAESNNASQQSSANENKRFAGKTLLMISFFYSVCMTPFPIFVVISMIDRTLLESKTSVEFLNACYYIVILNSGINSTIYIVRKKKMRMLYGRFFCHGYSN